MGTPDSTSLALALLAGLLVLFMYAGFGLMETGLCRAKNAAHTMSMTFLGGALAMTAFFLCGYAFLGGGSGGPWPTGTAAVDAGMSGHLLRIDHWGVLGDQGFLLSGLSNNPAALTRFLLTMLIMGVVAAIPTGSLIERWRLKSFCLFSLLVGGIIGPIYGCWVWGGGWLAQLGTTLHLGRGAVDYAGASVIHMQGGVLALVCSMLLGPRLGKFDAEGHPRPILGHHMPMVFLGTLLLALGWFAFVLGVSLDAGDGRAVLVLVNTILACVAGTLSAAFYVWFAFGKPDPSMICNGTLAGLASSAAACAFVAPWAAFLIGAIAGVLSIRSVCFWDRLGVDDPVGAISVHGIGGLWGLLAVGLLADGTYHGGNPGATFNVTGLLYGGGAGQLLAQLLTAGVCLLWAGLAGGVAFWGLGRILGGNRVPPEVEIAGLDIPELGAPAYPEFTTPIAPEQVPTSEISAARAQARGARPPFMQWAQA